MQEIEQFPPAQEAVPLVVLHALPHAPQWEVEVPSVTSQPLEALPSQLP